MGAKDKRERERLEATDKRKKEVISAAKEVFALKSIEKATIADIALQAEVGVASVYRYYSNKTELILGVAMDYLENELLFDGPIEGNGYEQTIKIMEDILKRINENPDMILFLEQLDTYVINLQNDHDQIKIYEKIKNHHTPRLIEAIEKGIKDGTIRTDIDANEIGQALIEVLITLAGKCILREQLLKEPCDGRVLVDVYKEMILNYLKAAC